ncbi:MAG: hypothetical protein JXX29_23720 [Deltaproteobacteria bacterium]|nr:hypothetical protein [Deltaproteobacteria bacterium]MBN2674710.1 hypothetical protein [Deltaproteobacteria bacterium]
MKQFVFIVMAMSMVWSCGSDESSVVADDDSENDTDLNVNSPLAAVNYCDYENVDEFTASDDQICGRRCCDLCTGEYDDSYYREVYPDHTPMEICMFECVVSLAERWESSAQEECSQALRSFTWCMGSASCQEREDRQSATLDRCDKPCGASFEAYLQYCRCEDVVCAEWDFGGTTACQPENAPVISAFSGSSGCVAEGDEVILTWSTENAVACTLEGPINTADDNEIQSVDVNGSLTFNSKVDNWSCLSSHWYLHCENEDGYGVGAAVNGCEGDCLATLVFGDSSSTQSSACGDCLDSCQGLYLDSCCTGTGCLCQDACTPSDCDGMRVRCCDDYGFCMCVDSCPY